MPTSRWGEEHFDFLTLYSKGIEFNQDEILNWHHEETPFFDLN